MEMKCIMVRNIGAFELTRTPIGNPMDDEVVIKVEVTGLCRTDLKLIRVGHRDLVLPRIPGEEVVGIICKMGSAVTGFREGDRVYVYPGIWCGICPSCLAGAQNLCRKILTLTLSFFKLIYERRMKSPESVKTLRLQCPNIAI